MNTLVTPVSDGYSMRTQIPYITVINVLEDAERDDRLPAGHQPAVRVPRTGPATGR
jgi:hypothetical protein